MINNLTIDHKTEKREFEDLEFQLIMLNYLITQSQEQLLFLKLMGKPLTLKRNRGIAKRGNYLLALLPMEASQSTYLTVEYNQTHCHQSFQLVH